VNPFYFNCAVQLPPAHGKEGGSGIERHKGKEESSGKYRGYVAGVYLIVKPSALADNGLRLVLVDRNGALFLAPVSHRRGGRWKESPDEEGQVLECPKISVTSAWLAGQHQNTAACGSGKREESAAEKGLSKRSRRVTVEAVPLPTLPALTAAPSLSAQRTQPTWEEAYGHALQLGLLDEGEDRGHGRIFCRTASPSPLYRGCWAAGDSDAATPSGDSHAGCMRIARRRCSIADQRDHHSWGFRWRGGQDFQISALVIWARRGAIWRRRESRRVTRGERPHGSWGRLA
jgi:hypothetical protein